MDSDDVCVTIIYVLPHDIIRFSAGFTFKCSVAVILKDETPSL